MKKLHLTLFLLLATNICSFVFAQIKPRRGLTGNHVVEFKQMKDDKIFFIDPIDDTINFKLVANNLYKGRNGKVYNRCVCFRPIANDTLLYQEYFRDITSFINLKTYKSLGDGYFINKKKVFIWWANSDGEYPIEVEGADYKTFVPFDSIAGGIDKYYVFYGGPPGDFEIINGANPKTIKVLNPANGCWNCGNSYFVDDKAVYYGLNKIAGADFETFRLVDLENIDAEDKNGKYFEGELVK